MELYYSWPKSVTWGPQGHLKGRYWSLAKTTTSRRRRSYGLPGAQHPTDQLFIEASSYYHQLDCGLGHVTHGEEKVSKSVSRAHLEQEALRQGQDGREAQWKKRCWPTAAGKQGERRGAEPKLHLPGQGPVTTCGQVPPPHSTVSSGLICGWIQWPVRSHHLPHTRLLGDVWYLHSNERRVYSCLLFSS